jgi:hypothetical protein
VRHYSFSHNTAVVDGDSAYNRRHGKGHFTGPSVPFGSLVNFMPQPDVKLDAFESKAQLGIFVGYHVLPGGTWKGDYLVAECAAVRDNPDVPIGRVKIHRIRRSFLA